MIQKIHSFNLICSLTLSVVWLQRNEGLTSTTHAPVLSNLKDRQRWFRVHVHLVLRFL